MPMFRHSNLHADIDALYDYYHRLSRHIIHMLEMIRERILDVLHADFEHPTLTPRLRIDLNLYCMFIPQYIAFMELFKHLVELAWDEHRQFQ